MAIGEAACVSVHGANRLGSNSLLDLVVFGRAAAHRARRDSSSPARAQAPLPAKAPATRRSARLDRLRHAKGGTPTGEHSRLEMQKTMQNNCAVFRTGDVLQEGVEKLRAVLGRPRRSRRQRPLADLEHRSGGDAGARQPARPGGGGAPFGAQPHGKPRRPRARGLSRARRRELDEAHARLAATRTASRASTTARCTCSR